MYISESALSIFYREFYHSVVYKAKEARHIRNLLRQLVCFLFKAVHRIGGNAMKQECDQLMTKPLDMSSQEILRDLNQAKVDIELIKQTLDTGVKQDIKKNKIRS